MNDAERLRAFQDMHDAVIAEHDDATMRLARLKDEGKTRTVTYRELFGRKTMLKAMLDLYERHGLREAEHEDR